MTLSRNYRVVLVIPGMARLVAATFLCTLPAGMANLAFLLGAERATGSIAVGGAAAGAYSIALALASPLWGRVVDRWGARPTLALATTGQSIAFTVHIGVAVVGGGTLPLAVSAFLAGACTPPTSALAKRIFMTVPQEQGQRTLFAMSGLLTEAVFVIGPLLVGVVVAVVDPLYAVVLTAIVSSIGTWWLRSAPAVRAMTRPVSAPPAQRAKREWNWPWAHVMLVVVSGAFAIGALQVSVVAHAGRAGASAGMFVAAMALGGVVAGFLYGAASIPASLPAQLSVSLGLYGLLILTIGFDPGAVVSLVLLLLIGAATGPADAIEAIMIGRLAPASMQSQAFAVLITANWLGFGAGSAVAGSLAQRASITVGVVSAAAAALLAAASLVLIPLVRQRLDH